MKSLENKIKIIATILIFFSVLIVVILLAPNIKDGYKFNTSSENFMLDQDSFSKKDQNVSNHLDDIKDVVIKGIDKENSRYIQIINPDTDAILCAGKTYSIKWDSNDVDDVIIKMKKGTSTYYITHNSINSLDGSNQFTWEAGLIFNEIILGDDFELSITSADDKYMVWDQANGYISIKECE